MTGSTTSGTGRVSRKPATVSISSREKSIPVLAASTPMSPKTASSSATTNSGGSSYTSVTPTVFWAVRATSALMPWQPAAANAFRSAWMPAHPPESEVAIVRQRGTMVSPFAGTNRIRFDGCDLSPERGTPVPECYGKRALVCGPKSGHAVVPAEDEMLAGATTIERVDLIAPVLWDDLLEGEELAHLATEEAREARTEAFPEGLHPSVQSALVRMGATSLYAHQAEAWRAVARGEHVIVTTGTASGKSLAFNLPVLSSLAAEPKNRALYLYPTKALAQDQARALAALKVPGVRSAIYDGDTESERRWQIRKWANLVLTNPDMLHVGVLPHHDRWGDVLSNLRYIVVDEAHVYRGVFGSHVGNVLRRLRRLARVYGAEPQFVLASATIANPGELARSLLGVEATVIDSDAAPRAERTIALWNPELLDVELGLRASPLAEASRLLAQLVSDGQRTICFAKSRKAVELVHRFTVDRVPKLAARLAPYRAGYTPQQRREIEQRLLGGELLAGTATHAPQPRHHL